MQPFPLQFLVCIKQGRGAKSAAASLPPPGNLWETVHILWQTGFDVLRQQGYDSETLDLKGLS